MKQEERDEIIDSVKKVLTRVNILQGYGRLFKELGIDEALENLTDREQKVLSMRFGLKDGVTHTLQEVGEEFCVNRERIRQIEAKAIERIRGQYNN